MINIEAAFAKDKTQMLFGGCPNMVRKIKKTTTMG